MPTVQKAERLDPETDPIGCYVRRNTAYSIPTWDVFHHGTIIGQIQNVESGEKPWLAFPKNVEPGLPVESAPRRSAALACIALLNRHYRLLAQAESRATSQQEE